MDVVATAPTASAANAMSRFEVDCWKDWIMTGFSMA
jgi:hypothetical protein